jgi:hypothetical protein
MTRGGMLRWTASGAKMTSNEERWNWIKGRAYYSIAGILTWATLSGKMSLHELMALLGRLESLAV